jgi:hypothetical protein
MAATAAVILVVLANSSWAKATGETSLRMFASWETPLYDAPELVAKTATSTMHAPSYLVATAAFGGARDRVRGVFLRAVAGMCEANMLAALLIDAAEEAPTFWERTLSSSAPALAQAHAGGWESRGGGKWPSHAGTGFELGCAARRSPVQVALRNHARAIGDQLTRAHQLVFWANSKRFDWFLYVEDDLGWDARAVLAVETELRALDWLAAGVAASGGGRLDGSGGRSQTSALPVPDDDDSALPGLAAAAAGCWTGFVRWEALAESAATLNAPERRRGGLAAMNDVTFAQVAANDFNWRVTARLQNSFERRVQLGGVQQREGMQKGASTYFAPANPFSASYVLPRPVLRAAFASGLPRTVRKLVKEYYGGYWLFEQAFFRDPRRRLRKLLPCDRARLAPLLVMHLSDSKYTSGAGARYSIVRSLEQFVQEVCDGRLPVVAFVSANHTIDEPWSRPSVPAVQFVRNL